MAGWGDGVVFCDRWAPVYEVGWNGTVWAKLDVAVTFIYKMTSEVSAGSFFPAVIWLTRRLVGFGCCWGVTILASRREPDVVVSAMSRLPM